MNYGQYEPTLPPPMPQGIGQVPTPKSTPVAEGIEMQSKLLSELENRIDVLRSRIAVAIAARPVEAESARPKEQSRAQSQLTSILEAHNYQLASFIRIVSNLIEGVEL